MCAIVADAPEERDVRAQRLRPRGLGDSDHPASVRPHGEPIREPSRGRHMGARSTSGAKVQNGAADDLIQEEHGPKGNPMNRNGYRMA